MAADEVNALVISPPMDNDVYARLSGAASESVELPEEFYDGWITIRVEDTTGAGNTCYINFSIGPGIADPVANSAVIAPAAPAFDGTIPLAAGSEVHFSMATIRGEANESIFLNHAAPAAGGARIVWWRSSGPTVA